MNDAERPMRVAAARTLGVFLVILAPALAVGRAAQLITWHFELDFDQEAKATAAIALLAALFTIAGLRRAMRMLSRSIAADDAFKELVHSATPAGQLYGLCGLYHTDPLAFRLALPRYRAMAGEVDFSQGCVTSPRKIAEVACSDRRDTPDICGGALPSFFSQRDFDEAAALKDEKQADFRR